MATTQGWEDFDSLTSQWQRVKGVLASLKNECDTLAALKIELIDDADRKAEMTPIGNQYPGYNMNSICTDVETMIAAKAVLTAAGY